MAHSVRTSLRQVQGAWFLQAPLNWIVCKLGFRYAVDLGKMLDEKQQTGRNPVPYLRNQDVQWDRINTNSLPHIDISPEEVSRYTVNSGDILVCEGGDVGRAAIWSGSAEPVAYQKALHRLRPRNPECDVPRFLFYSLLAAKLAGAFEESDAKATISHLPADRFRQYRFAFPDIRTQVDVVGFLDRETIRVDTLIEKKNRFIELLREKRQTLTTQLVTQGLDPSKPKKRSGIEWVGEVPSHWAVTQLKHVVAAESSITYGIVQAGPEIEGGIPYIKTSDMAGDVLPSDGYSRTSPEIEAAFARSRVRPGDIVMSIRASIGKCLPVPPSLPLANLTQGTAKISPGAEMDKNFLLAYLNSGAAQTYFSLMAKGATFKEITLDALRRTPVLQPPLDEQRMIARHLEAAGQRLDRLVQQTSTSIDLLKERRAALITAAVTGQIDLREAA